MWGLNQGVLKGHVINLCGWVDYPCRVIRASDFLQIAFYFSGNCQTRGDNLCAKLLSFMTNLVINIYLCSKTSNEIMCLHSRNSSASATESYEYLIPY